MKCPKPHLLESYEAVIEGSKQEALCGAEIKRVKFVTLAESDYLPGDRMNSSAPKGVCNDCLRVKTFRYLVCESTEAE